MSRRFLRRIGLLNTLLSFLLGAVVTGLAIGGGYYGGVGVAGTSPATDVNLLQVGGSTASTAATGTLKVGIVGNAGGIVDAAGQNATSPANEVLVGGQFNTTPTVITSGNMSPLQMDQRGNLLVNLNAQASPLIIQTVSNDPAFPPTGLPSVLARGHLAFGSVSATSPFYPIGTVAPLALTPFGEAKVAITNTPGVSIPGLVICNTRTKINQTGNTLLVTGISGVGVHVCAVNLVTATAQNVALVGGTGATCGTGTVGIAGGTTAATGWNFAANGGLAQGIGLGVIMEDNTAGDSVCLLQSGSGQVSGAIAWAQF